MQSRMLGKLTLFPPLLVHALCLTVLLIVYGLFLPRAWNRPDFGNDWRLGFYPAFQAALHGHSPYSIAGLFNPPWTFILIAPFALLPERVSTAVYFAFTLASYPFIARRLGAKPIALTAFLLSPASLIGARLMNVDIWVLWGFVLPPPIAILFVLVKPQMGILYAAYLAWDAWRTDGMARVVAILYPTFALTTASFLLLGNWLPAGTGQLTRVWWNVAIWPYGLLAGVPLLLLMLWKRNRGAAIAASPFFSPYLSIGSWNALVAGTLQNDALTVIAVVALAAWSTLHYIF